MKKAFAQLSLQSLSLVGGFIVWVLISSLLPFIKDDIPLSPGRMAWVTAVPVLLGSLLRIPIGYWTNRFGARVVFTTGFLLLMTPVYALSLAHSFGALLACGLFIGLGGALFSVGVTSLPKYFPRERHGLVNGIYGMGNIGTAITSFSAPILAKQMGWPAAVRLTLIVLAVFALASLLLGDRHEPKVSTPLSTQMRSVYRNQKLWFLCLFYFITFGSFVAFTVYLPNFLVSHFGLDKVDAGLRTAGFIVLCTLIRPLGGYLADRFNAFKVLLVVFAGLTASGVILSFSLSIGLYSAGCLMIAACAGIGNGAVFKLVPLYFSKQGGIVNGIVSACGGLGGFFPPLVLTFVYNLTGHYAIGFMALSEFALAAFILTIWLFYQEKLQFASTILEHTTEGIMVTDAGGIIRQVNPAFTRVTGYSPAEAIGRNPSLLKSGRQNAAFYQAMWEEIRERGVWQGEIWNRRKDGVIYREWLTISSIKADGDEVKYYAGMFSDISDHRFSS